MNNKRIYWLFGLLLITALLVGLVGCSGSPASPTPSPTTQKPSPTASPATSPTASPSASPTAKPSPTASPSPTAPRTVFKIRHTTHTPPAYTMTQAGTWFYDEVAKRSNGWIQVEQFYNAAMAKAPDTLPTVSKGVAEAGWWAQSYNPAEAGIATIFDVFTFMTLNQDVTGKVADDLYRKYKPMQDVFTKLNVRPLYWEAPERNIFTASKAYSDIASLKGAKIRAYGYVAKTLEKLGATPVGIAFGDIYTSLQRGVIDASTVHPAALSFTSSFHEVAPYFIDPGFGPATAVTEIINLDTWNSFPPALQAIFEEVAKEAPEYYYRIGEKEELKALEGLIKYGTKFIVWTPEESAKAKALVQPWILEQYAQDVAKPAGVNPDELIKTINELFAKYGPTGKAKSAADYYLEKYGK